MRINKYIASSGIASRRAAEKLVLSGKVKINNKVIKDLSTTVNTENDTVTINGRKIAPIRKMLYVMLNKPKGCITTVSDDLDRKTIMDYIKPLQHKRVYPVGRLDYNTEGLLLITNDGDLTNKLTHPSNEVPKTYNIKVEQKLTNKELDILREGIELDGEQLKECKIRLLNKESNNIYRYEVTITEGKNRQLHRMFEYINKEITFLKRTAIGSLRLGGLTRGTFRYLSTKEINYLKNL